MSRDYDSSDSIDYPAAVAAAAFAITSIEEKSEYDHRRTNSGGDKPLTKIKSKGEDIAKKPEKLSGRKKFPMIPRLSKFIIKNHNKQAINGMRIRGRSCKP